MASSIVTLQKHVRGWLTRRKMKILQERIDFEKRQEQERKEKAVNQKKNGKSLVKSKRKTLHETGFFSV